MELYISQSIISYMANLESLMILAGGRGTRFKEYTEEIPKPMIQANGRPLLLHIIDLYKKFDIKNVVILAGYKKEVISDYFLENSTPVDLKQNIYLYDQKVNITILDTGLDTMTGGRIKQGAELIDEDMFYMTYGDGIANVDIEKLTNFHISNKAKATLTAVRPPARFGSLDLENDNVIKFGEKDSTNEGWINGGYFVLNKDIVNYIDNLDSVFEKEPLEKVALEGKLFAYKHELFWQCVDTIRELEILEAALRNNKIST